MSPFASLHKPLFFELLQIPVGDEVLGVHLAELWGWLDERATKCATARTVANQRIAAGDVLSPKSKLACAEPGTAGHIHQL